MMPTSGRQSSARTPRNRKLPSGTRRAAARLPDSMSQGAKAPPRLAPSTSASASGSGTTPASASDMMRRTMATLE